MQLVKDDEAQIKCIHVTIKADKKGGVIRGLDLFDPTASLVVRSRKSGEIIPNFAGGGDPQNAVRSIFIPPDMCLTFVVSIPNNKIFDTKEKGDFEISVGNIKGQSIIVYYNKRGELSSR